MGGSSSDSRKRENIAFNRPIDWDQEAQLGTIFFGVEKHHQFPPLDIATIRSLAEAGHLDFDAAHNDAPTAGELLEFASYVVDEFRDYQFEVGLTGYMVSPERVDSRIRVDGLSIRSAGVIPDRLKEEVIRGFSPDLLTVDDFVIRLKWD